SLREIAIEKSRSNTPIPSRRPSFRESSTEKLPVPQQELSPLPINNQSLIFEEITRLRELIEEKFQGQTDQLTSDSVTSSSPTRQSIPQIYPPRQQLFVDTRVPLPV
ncbi:unnamed protein product, partial [Rotaria magnacalcarata]